MTNWNYEGDTGPEHWADLDPAYVVAREGRRQSPIDLVDAVAADLPALRFDYRDSGLRVEDAGAMIQAEYDPGSAIEVEGRRFDLLNFHFHSPSEHLVRGEGYDLELHLVHCSDDYELAVVGVFIRTGTANAHLAPIVAHLPAEPGGRREPEGVRVHAGRLLPPDHGHFRYHGSRTMPPCTEGVRWFVLSSPIEASPDQIAALRALHDGNARPVQPRYERFLLRAR